eukprot:3364517-Pleurochrysis_carterae.AAC.2
MCIIASGLQEAGGTERELRRRSQSYQDSSTQVFPCAVFFLSFESLNTAHMPHQQGVLCSTFAELSTKAR